jgi:hypothetical protein
MNINDIGDTRTTASGTAADDSRIPDEWLAALSRGLAVDPQGTPNAAVDSAERKALAILSGRLTSILRY